MPFEAKFVWIMKAVNSKIYSRAWKEHACIIHDPAVQPQAAGGSAPTFSSFGCKLDSFCKKGPKTFTTAAQHNQGPRKKPRLFSSAGIMEELQLHRGVPVSWPGSQPVDTCWWVQMLSLPSTLFSIRKSNWSNLFFSTVLAQCAR